MKTPFSLDGKVALVTGAAKGIGLVTARVLAEGGASVVLSDIDFDACEAAAEVLLKAGLSVKPLRLNVCEEEDWQAAIVATLHTYGGLDVLVNNAGIYIGGTLLSNSVEQLDQMHKVNVDSVFLGMKCAAEVMKPGGLAGKGGSIINLSSAAGLVGVPGHSAYGSTKGAVRLYTKHAAVEFGFLKYGIRVNSVHPGPIDTDMGDQVLDDFVEVGLAPDANAAAATIDRMVPLGRMGNAEDVAYVIHFLASEASRYCTGAEFAVDGGLTAA